MLDFIKIVNTVQSTKLGLKRVKSAIKELAMAEGLVNHYEAVRQRMEK